MQKVIVGISVVLVLVIGFVVYVMMNLNSLVKDGIETIGPEVLGVAVTVDSVDLALLEGRGSLSGLRIANPEGYDTPYAFELDQVSFITGEVITADRIHLTEVIISSPAITYEGNLTNSNLKDLQARAAGSADEDEPTAAAGDGMPIQIDHFEINGAQLGVHLKFLDEPLALVVPQIVINDIGKDGEAMPADVLAQVMREINRSVIPLIRDNAGGIGDKVKEGIDKLKGLFGK